MRSVPGPLRRRSAQAASQVLAEQDEHVGRVVDELVADHAQIAVQPAGQRLHQTAHEVGGADTDPGGLGDPYSASRGSEPRRDCRKSPGGRPSDSDQRVGDVSVAVGGIAGGAAAGIAVGGLLAVAVGVPAQ